MTETPDPTSRFLSFYPILEVDDLEAAVAYYEQQLGFTVAWRWGSPPSRAGVARDAVELQLVSAPDARPRSSIQVYVHMSGIDGYYRQCVERGAELTSELELRPWGMRDFRLRDPSGNQLGFGESA